jgi:Protein of unknown function (DUF4231)
LAGDANAPRLTDDLGAVVEDLDLHDRQKLYLRSRWLDQIAWFERSAKRNQRRYYALRLVAIVGGVIGPALVSLNVRENDVASAIAWTTFGVSLVVAAAVAVEEFFHYGERWRHYRRTAELLKSQGWQYFELAGAYAGYRTHGAGFRAFAATIESLIADDVETYLTQVTRERVSGAEPGEPAPGG